jgi:hypothetical protein
MYAHFVGARCTVFAGAKIALGLSLARQPMERVAGIEPASSAWEADVMPLNYTRDKIYYIVFSQKSNTLKGQVKMFFCKIAFRSSVVRKNAARAGRQV